MSGEGFSKIIRGNSMKRKVSVEGEFVFDAEVNGEPVECVKDGGDSSFIYRVKFVPHCRLQC